MGVSHYKLLNMCGIYMCIIKCHTHAFQLKSETKEDKKHTQTGKLYDENEAKNQQQPETKPNTKKNTTIKAFDSS